MSDEHEEDLEDEESDEVEESGSSSYSEGKSTRGRDHKGASKAKQIKNCLMYDQIRRQLLRAPGSHDVADKYVTI